MTTLTRTAAALALALTLAAGLPGASVAAYAATTGATARPYWDGRAPHVWTSQVPPLCQARYHGRHGWIRPDGTGPAWRAVCVIDGQQYAWGEQPAANTN